MEHAQLMAREVLSSTEGIGLQPIFKASFEKANRTSASGYRGPGIEQGLEVLSEIRRTSGLRVTTDVHESNEVEKTALAVDILQIPAFLARQTRLLEACASTDRTINVKKAQFMSGYDMAKVVEKLQLAGAKEVIVTERGTMFGYNNLVVDFRNLEIMKSLGVLVCIDATHSVQLPGAMGGSSGGERRFAPLIARAAAITGVDGYFMETHDDPDNAPSDGPNMIPVQQLKDLLRQIAEIHKYRKTLTPIPIETV
jgi:2-dehydro-3-deoxyphosphooctonate aldolase (KDO 8-P synthase)